MKVPYIKYILPLLMICSCVDKSEKKIEYYPDGKVKVEMTYVGDNKNGKTTEYYHAGGVKTISNFKNDTLDGFQEMYFENGKLSAKINYYQGKKNGEFSTYYKNGFIASRGFFKDDLRRGHFYEYQYTDSGKIKSEAYIIVAQKEEYLYYLREYDRSGNLLNETRSLKVEKSDGEKRAHSALINISYVDKISYDSIKVLIGPYSSQFELPPGSSADTLSLKGNKVSFTITNPRNDMDTTIRGKFLGYKTFLESDTLVNSTRVEFFEEKIRF